MDNEMNEFERGMMAPAGGVACAVGFGRIPHSADSVRNDGLGGLGEKGVVSATGLNRKGRKDCRFPFDIESHKLYYVNYVRWRKWG
jgi:hypothetical protein